MHTDNLLDEKSFFYNLLQKTETAYRQSDVRLKNPNWSYSICGTPIVRGAGLLAGLNWGGGGTGEIFVPQTYPDGSDIERYTFIRRISPYLEKHLNLANARKLNYSNLSFFRSPRVTDLTERDWELSKDLFLNFLQYVSPPWIVLSTSRIERAKLALDLTDITPFIAGKDRTFCSYRAKCFIKDQTIKLFAFPHPNAKVPGWVRNELWHSTFTR